jgi:predicted nuclease of restriction endonuclease-like RecB superfamily
LFETDERQVKRDIAQSLDRSWGDIDSELFADVIEFHRLEQFAGYENGRALLARYNVAQVQVALFRAVAMTVWARADFKAILRYAKLARLMHTISRTVDGRYVFRFDGPASVLRTTRRYGVAMARFLPALLSCRDWRMHAVIQTRQSGRSMGLDLTSEDGLHSPVPAPDEFDSSIEEAFARKWGDEPRDGWHLERETEVLHDGQKVFVPDFVFRHEDGRNVLLEIIGFWTPEYLQKKLQTLATFADRQIVLAISHQVGQKLDEVPPQAVVYKSALHVGEILERLKECRKA